MKSLHELEHELNQMIASGKIIEAVSEYFAPDATFQEGNQPPRMSRQEEIDHLTAFFKTLSAFNGATLHAETVGNDVTMSEWTFDMVGPEGRMIWNEVLRRRWKDGKVISERFYAAT